MSPAVMAVLAVPAEAEKVTGDPHEVPAAEEDAPALEKPLSAPERLELELMLTAPPVTDWRAVNTDTCTGAA